MPSPNQQRDSLASLLQETLWQAEDFKRKWRSALEELEKQKLAAEGVEVSFESEIARLMGKIEERDGVVLALEGRVRGLEGRVRELELEVKEAGGRFQDGADGELDELEGFDILSLGEPGGTVVDSRSGSENGGDDHDESADDGVDGTHDVFADPDCAFVIEPVELTLPLALEDGGVWRFATSEEMKGDIELTLVRRQGKLVREYFYGVWRSLGEGNEVEDGVRV